MSLALRIIGICCLLGPIVSRSVNSPHLTAFRWSNSNARVEQQPPPEDSIDAKEVGNANGTDQLLKPSTRFEKTGSFDEPKASDIVFELYTSKQEQFHRLVANDSSSLKQSSFDPKRWTVCITHGFLENADKAEWMHTMKERFLKMNYNVILVQWAILADAGLFDYETAAKNTVFVGNQLGALLHNMKIHNSLSGERVYLIGFSLGAHVCGFTGKNFPGIARITGLDPAGPSFSSSGPQYRLAITDAKFVDAVHTSDLGFLYPIGHVDFFMNGGTLQHSCGMLDFSCAHGLSHQFFIDSLDESPAIAYKCSNYTRFQSGLCFNEGTNYFGIAAEAARPGVYYIDTLYSDKKENLLLALHYRADMTFSNCSENTMDMYLEQTVGNRSAFVSREIKNCKPASTRILSPLGKHSNYMSLEFTSEGEMTLETLTVTDPRNRDSPLYACNVKPEETVALSPTPCHRSPMRFY